MKPSLRWALTGLLAVLAGLAASGIPGVVRMFLQPVLGDPGADMRADGVVVNARAGMLLVAVVLAVVALAALVWFAVPLRGRARPEAPPWRRGISPPRRALPPPPPPPVPASATSALVLLVVGLALVASLLLVAPWAGMAVLLLIAVSVLRTRPRFYSVGVSRS